MANEENKGEREGEIKQEKEKVFLIRSILCMKYADVTLKYKCDFALIKSNLFEVTQFHSTPLPDLKLVSVMLTQTLHYRSPLSFTP